MSGRFTRTEIVADGIRKDVLVEGAGDACPRPGDSLAPPSTRTPPVTYLPNLALAVS